MKKQLILLLLSMATWNPGISQTLIRKVLLTLQPGEKIMYGESCLSLAMGTGQVYLVTHAGDQYYVYENGQKRGPYGDLEEAGVKSCREEADPESRCSIYQPEDQYEPSILTPNDDGSYSISLNNKKYGPYPLISNLHVWPDKSGFVALVMDQDMKIHVVTSEGLNLALDGDVERISYSPSGKKFVFAMKEKQAMDMEILKMDFSKMSQEELMAFAKKQEIKAQKAVPLQSYVFVNGTKKLGPYPHDAFYSTNPGFPATGGENWIMTVNNELYINGVKANVAPDVSIDPCHVWLSGDGKRYAVGSYDKIFFSDGKIYDHPLESAAAEKGGKLTIRWITLENEKDLVAYSREL